MLANQGRSVKPTTIDYVEDRNGKVIYRTDNRCAVMGNCNAADWDGKAMPRPPSRTRQLLDPMAAFQMVHIMEGVIQRGTATVLARPQPAAVRQDRHDQRARPTSGSSAAPPTSLPASTWAMTSRGRSAAMRRAAGSAAPIWKQWAQTALKDQPKVPFVAPPGIRWVRIDRASGKPVYGVFPTTEDPEVVGDLGSVPAADRAAAQLPQRDRRSL